MPRPRPNRPVLDYAEPVSNYSRIEPIRKMQEDELSTFPKPPVLVFVFLFCIITGAVVICLPHSLTWVGIVASIVATAIGNYYYQKYRGVGRWD